MFQNFVDVKLPPSELLDHRPTDKNIVVGVLIGNFLLRLKKAIFPANRISGVSFYSELDD